MPMTATEELLERIDDVVVERCHAPGCAASLAGSVSEWFCSQDCQRAWTAHHHDVEQIGYDPYEWGGYYSTAARWTPTPGLHTVAGMTSLAEALAGVTEHLARLREAVAASWDATFLEHVRSGVWTVLCDEAASNHTARSPAAGLLMPGWATDPPPVTTRETIEVAGYDPALRALEARRRRNTGPAVHADPRRNRSRR